MKYLILVLLTGCVTWKDEEEAQNIRLHNLEQKVETNERQLRETRCFLDYVMCKDSVNKEEWTGLALCKGTLDGCLNNMDGPSCDPSLMAFYPKGWIIPSIGSCPSMNVLDLPTKRK